MNRMRMVAIAPPSGDADGEVRLALSSHRVPVDRGRCSTRGARHVDEDGRDGTCERGARIDARDQDQGHLRRERQRERQHERRRIRTSEARQDADDEAGDEPESEEGQRLDGEEQFKTEGDVLQRCLHGQSLERRVRWRA